MYQEAAPSLKEDLERLARARRLSHQVRFYTPQEWADRELEPGISEVLGLAILEPDHADLVREIHALSAASGWQVDVTQRGREHRFEFRPAAA